MKILSSEKTQYSPAMNFNATTGICVIEGESYPENARSIYLPVLEWLEEYKKAGITNLPMKFRFSFDYLNSLSLKYVYDILKKLESFSDSGITFDITWDYHKDDEETRENGEEFAKIFKFNFKLIQRS